MTRKRTRKNADSPEAAYYFRELSAGRITPAVVERRIAELNQEAEDLEYFERNPERSAKLRTLAAEFTAVLGRDRAEAVARGVDEALETPSPPKPAEVVVKPEAAPVVDHVPEKTHECLRLDKNERDEIGSFLRQIRAGRMTPATIRESLSNLRDQLPNVKSKERELEIQTRIMILDQVLYLLKNPARKTNPGKGKRKNTDEELRKLEREGGLRGFMAWARVHAPWLTQSSVQSAMRVSARNDERTPVTLGSRHEVHFWPWPEGAHVTVMDPNTRRGLYETLVPWTDAGFTEAPPNWPDVKPRKTNPDEDLRGLEREALSGDGGARTRWLRGLARVDPERLKLREKIIRAAARALFVDAWDSSEREEGREHRGELMDLAPDTIPSAYEKAEDLIAEFERLNTKSVDQMYKHAAELSPEDHLKDPIPEDFGHYTAMQALGHGVSWGDDHPEHGFKVPYTEYVLVPSDYGAESCEACQGGEKLKKEGQRCRACGRHVYKGRVEYR